MGHISLSAARSLEEEQQETLTVHRLGVVWILRRTPTSINPIGRRFATVERVARRVKRWREGEQVLRWTATGSLDAAKEIPASELEVLHRRMNPSLTQQAQVA